MTFLLGSTPFLKPNPHSLTSGATVMSKAPWVSLEMSSAKRKTSVNIELTTGFSLRFTFEIMEVLLNGESDSSTFFSSASISFFRLVSL